MEKIKIDWKSIKKDGYPTEEKDYLWLSNGSMSMTTDVTNMKLSEAKIHNAAMRMPMVLDGWRYVGWADISDLTNEQKAELICYDNPRCVNKDVIDFIPDVCNLFSEF